MELQEKFADKDLQIISVSDEPLGTVEGFLQRGYSGGGEDGPQTYADLTSAYCLTTDPDRSVHTAYMEAAGQNGIPTAFIVGKTGEIEWIGHPMTMDGPLSQIVSDNWDREAFAKNERLMGQIQQLAQQGKTDEAMKLIEQAKATADEAGLAQLARMTQQIKLAPIGLMIQSGDLAGAITAIGEVIDTADEEMLPQLQFTRLAMMIQLKQDDEAATAIGELTETMDAKFLDSIAWNVYQRASQEEEFSQPLLDAATAASEKAMEKVPEETSILDTLAHLMELQGDLDRAIELATKAAENAPDEIKEKLQGYVEELQAKADPAADSE